MRFILPMTLGLALVGAAGCGDYYYPGADYPEGYNAPEETAQAPQASAAAGSVGAIPTGAVDTNAQLEGAPGQDVMIGDTGDYADTDPSALTDFKTALDPYGTWYDDPTYGTVWQPSPSIVGADFAPYVTAGHWTYDDDYVWVSDYDWGWAPFHYGRWIYIAGRGWSWVPGRTYAGAWVSWRVGDPDYGYVGWGPLPPSWYWQDGYAYDLGFAVYTPYTFCGRGDLFSPSVSTRVLAGAQVATVAGGTHVYVPSNHGGGGVNGRTPASPQVGSPLGGAGRLRMPFGPPPSMLGFSDHVTPRPPIDNVGLSRARQFAHPSSAIALGAHGPQLGSRPAQVPYPPRGTLGGADRPVATAPQYRYPNGTHYAPPAYRGPTYYPPANRGPAYHGSPATPSYPPAYRGNPSFSSSYPARVAPPAYRASPSAPAYRASPSAPAYRSAPAWRSAPAYRSAPSYSAPSYRSAPSFHSAPAYHPPSSSSSYSHSYSHSSGGRHR